MPRRRQTRGRTDATALVNRRALLRGAGATILLPWMESINAFGAAPAARLGARKPPTRFAALYFPNGVLVEEWGATGEGTNFRLKPILASLEPVKKKILIPSGLWHERLDSRGAHNGKTSGFLSGIENYKIQGNRLKVATSFDQVLAKSIGHETPLPSICFGTKPDVTIKREYSSIYRSYVSWISPSQPAPKEIDPRFAFDRLFADKERQQRNKTILDSVSDQVGDLQRQVSRADREKLDEFLTSVREVEQRVENSEKKDAERWEPGELPTNIARPTIMPEDREEHTKLMLDLIVLAFQMNKTRLATFMFDNGGCSGNFSFLPGVTEQWHSASHHRERPGVMKQYADINRWHVEQLAYLLGRMDAIQEGEGTLLDHSIVMTGSGLKDGNKHTAHDLPLVVAGRGSGAIQTGRAVDYPPDTALTKFFLVRSTCHGCTVRELLRRDHTAPTLELNTHCKPLPPPRRTSPSTNWVTSDRI